MILKCGSNFMLINFLSFRIFIFLIIPVGKMLYLGYRVGLVFLCSKKLPENDTPLPKHVGV